MYTLASARLQFLASLRLAIRFAASRYFADYSLISIFTFQPLHRNVYAPADAHDFLTHGFRHIISLLAMASHSATRSLAAIS